MSYINIARSEITKWFLTYLTERGVVVGIALPHDNGGWTKDPQDPEAEYVLHSVIYPGEVSVVEGSFRRPNEILEVPYSVTSNADGGSFAEFQADNLRKLVLDIDKTRPSISTTEGAWRVMGFRCERIGALSVNRNTTPHECSQTDLFVFKLTKES